MAEETASSAATEEPAATAEPAKTEAPEDPYAWFDPNALPEDKREAWSKAFGEIKSKVSALESEKAELGPLAEFAKHISAIEGFEDFADTPQEVTFRTLIDAWKAQQASGQPKTDAPKPPAAPAGVDPQQWKSVVDTVNAFNEQQAQLKANQQVANLLNSRPEAKELLKDPAIKARLVELTGEDNEYGMALPLDAAYALAAGQKAAELKANERIKAAATGEKPPAVEAGGKSDAPNAPPKFNSPEDAIRAAFKKHGVQFDSAWGD